MRQDPNIWTIAHGSRIREHGKQGSSSLYLFALGWNKSNRTLLKGRGTAGWLGSFNWQTVLEADIEYIAAFLALGTKQTFQDMFLSIVGNPHSETFALPGGSVHVLRHRHKPFTTRDRVIPPALSCTFQFEDQRSTLTLNQPLFQSFRQRVQNFDPEQIIQNLAPAHTE